jgi:hypothetical protein
MRDFLRVLKGCFDQRCRCRRKKNHYTWHHAVLFCVCFDFLCTFRGSEYRLRFTLSVPTARPALWPLFLISDHPEYPSDCWFTPFKPRSWHSVSSCAKSFESPLFFNQSLFSGWHLRRSWHLQFVGNESGNTFVGWSVFIKCYLILTG